VNVGAKVALPTAAKIAAAAERTKMSLREAVVISSMVRGFIGCRVTKAQGIWVLFATCLFRSSDKINCMVQKKVK